MKNYNKINKYYLELLMKGQKVYWDYNGLESGYLLTDSYILSCVPSMYLNKDIMLKTNLEKFLELPFEDYKEVSHIIFIDRIGDTIGLKHGDIEVCINKKYYQLYKGCTFKVLSDIKPVLVYDKENLVAFILPIKRY